MFAFHHCLWLYPCFLAHSPTALSLCCSGEVLLFILCVHATHTGTEILFRTPSNDHTPRKNCNLTLQPPISPVGCTWVFIHAPSQRLEAGLFYSQLWHQPAGWPLAHHSVIFCSVSWVPYTACSSGVAELPQDAERAGYYLTTGYCLWPPWCSAHLPGLSCISPFLMSILQVAAKSEKAGQKVLNRLLHLHPKIHPEPRPGSPPSTGHWCQQCPSVIPNLGSFTQWGSWSTQRVERLDFISCLRRDGCKVVNPQS